MNAPVDLRIAALRRFALAITILNILGHTVLGFEQSWAHPLVGVGTAYALELLLEWVRAKTMRVTPKYSGGFKALVHFLLPAHISGLAIAMLLYTHERFTPIIFAVAVAIGSKVLFRAPIGRGTRHIFNPSNFGIAVTLLTFPAFVGVTPLYHFTHRISGTWDWIVPLVIICAGSFLNSKYTRKMPLILGWLSGFLIQALVRSTVFDSPIVASLAQVSGVAFLLFTFYMVTDPGTTPAKPRAQFLFGLAIAAFYAAFISLHLVFGLFLSLVIVCGIRGVVLHTQALFARQKRAPRLEGALAKATVQST